MKIDLQYFGGRGASSSRGAGESSKTWKFTAGSGGLPKLEGSEKQIKWANDIRNEFIKTFNEGFDEIQAREGNRRKAEMAVYDRRNSILGRVGGDGKKVNEFIRRNQRPNESRAREEFKKFKENTKRPKNGTKERDKYNEKTKAYRRAIARGIDKDLNRIRRDLLPSFKKTISNTKRASDWIDYRKRLWELVKL